MRPGLAIGGVPGTPEGLRSPDLHLERVASCQARRPGHWCILLQVGVVAPTVIGAGQGNRILIWPCFRKGCNAVVSGARQLRIVREVSLEGCGQELRRDCPDKKPNWERPPANLSYLRCHNRIGASKGLWIPAAARMTGRGVSFEGCGQELRRDCPDKKPNWERPPTNLSYLRCHNRVGASKGLWIPAAARMTGRGVSFEGCGQELRRDCPDKKPNWERPPTNLSYLRCHNRIGASKGLWIPAAARMTGRGVSFEGCGQELRRDCPDKKPNWERPPANLSYLRLTVLAHQKGSGSRCGENDEARSLVGRMRSRNETGLP